MGALQHIADIGVEPQLAALPVVPAVDQNLSLGWFKEPAGQVDQGGFARPGLPHNGHGGARGYMEAEVLQHIVPAVGIAEGHVLELNLSLEGLPVLPLGVEGVSVFFYDLGGIGDLGLLIEQVGDPLDGRLEGNELRQVGRGDLNGFKDAHGIGDKDRQGGDIQRLLRRQVAPPQQHDGHRQGGEEQRQRNIHRVEPGGPHTGTPHGVGELPEALDALILNHQGFGRLGPGDTLVEGPGDLGVELAHLAVPVEDAGLEPARQRRHHRHDEDDHQRQPPVQGQHGCKTAQHIQHPPRHVRQVPCDVAGDAVGVVHHPGDEVAHWGDVVKGQGQGLQMAEEIPSHVPAQVHLHVHGPACKAHHHQRLQCNSPQIGRCVGRQAVQRPPLDKVADGVLLEQGKDHVHQGG